MESLAPGELAEPWDNSGLQVGNNDRPVNTVWVALDPAPAVVAAACSHHVDLLITHHPLIFQALKTLDLSTPVGTILDLAIRHRLAIFSAHTNFDSAADGLNDILADKIGLVDTKMLIAAAASPLHGMGRVGSLRRPTPLATYAAQVRDKLGIDTVRYAGRPDLVVNRAAICTGSGGSLMDTYLSCGAEVFITGDVRYHDARTAEWADVGLIDIGHFASEHIMVKTLAGRLSKIFKARGEKLTVSMCDLEKDPFRLV